MLSSTQRFSSRVENYVKYRPHYPTSLLTLLQTEYGLTPGWVIADIGSGTGISSELFLQNGNIVCGVEPNQDMRRAGEEYLKQFPKFVSVNGTAEATTLPESSIDLIIAGQAFHWFDQPTAKREFQRILKPEGKVVLVWNERDDQSSPFLIEYEKLLQTYCPEYHLVDHRNIDDNVIENFFTPNPVEKQNLSNTHIHDYDGILGRLLSSSYAPTEESELYEPMLTELRRIFDLYNDHGTVAIEYQTKVYISTSDILVGRSSIENPDVRSSTENPVERTSLNEEPESPTEIPFIHPTIRFSNRVEYYVKYRPHYPLALVEVLKKECGLDPEWVVADIGSGTGFSSEPFLINGNVVCGVEPNDEMRRAGDEFLQYFPKFMSVDGTAESTTLDDESIDLIFAGSAFHWFDLERAKPEFHRILKPGGIIAVGWSGGMSIPEIRSVVRKYRIEVEPERYNHDNKKFDFFFGENNYRELSFAHSQTFDWEALHGRVLSMSFSPLPGHQLYDPMVEELRRVFDDLQHDGIIKMEFKGKVFVGK